MHNVVTDTDCSTENQLEKPKCECTSLISAVDSGLTEKVTKSNSGQPADSYSNYHLIPRWLVQMDMSNPEFCTYVENIISQECSKLLPNIGTPIFSCWITLMSGSTNIAACVVLTLQGIFILKLKSLDRTLQNGQNEEKWPTLCHLLTFLPTEILSVVTGPCNSYVEVQIGSLAGIQTYVLLTMCQDATTLLTSKLAVVYEIKASKKHTLHEVESAVSRGLQQFAEYDNSATKDMLYCRRVLRLHCSEHKDAIHYLALTPTHLLSIEEIPDLHPMCDLRAAFHVCTAVTVRTNIVSVIMKDDNFTSQILPSKNSLDKSDCLGELYACGFWLLVDFETGDLFHIRFLNQEDRSKFLEIFLSARGT